MTITLAIATVDVEPGWAVGAVAHGDTTIDRDLLLDADGQPWIPGSALAGSLRAHLANADPSADIRLMGSRPPRDQAQAATLTASPLWIVGAMFVPSAPDASEPAESPPMSEPAALAPTASADAPPRGPDHDGAVLETIGQTAIDRRRGAARAGSLRISRLAASGGRLSVYLRHDGGDQPLSDDDLALIASWRPAIGRDRTRGGGRARLTGLRHGTVDPATPDGARTWLTHDGPELFETVATTAIACDPVDQPWLEASFDIIDGLLVGDNQTEPLASTRKRHGRPLVPGSAWKGIIRSRVEFIVRSRYGEDAACTEQAGCGECVVCAGFGHQGQRGLLSFRDSYIEDPGQETKQTHVGIDRVTGGARDALLFETMPLTAGRLRLRIDQLGPVEPWVRNAIRHVLRDIDDGLIGVGSRTTRGLGTLRLAEPQDAGALEPVVIGQLDASQTKEPSR